MRAFVLTLGFCLFSGFSLIAQAYQIFGQTYTEDGLQGLPYVLVSIEGTNLSTTSNRNGTFILDVPEMGVYHLKASCLGFVSQQQIITIADSHPQEVEFKLREALFQLPTTEISAISMTGGLLKRQGLPGSAVYLPAQALKRHMSTDIHSILSQAPGINFQEEDGFGLRPNIGLRATGVDRSARITVMEDGILSAPAPYAAPAAYYFPTIGRMHAIEILKGSSQIKYGPYTTGGALNMLSTPIPSGFEGQFNFAAGNFGNRQLHAYAGDHYERFGFLAETFQYRSDGFKTLERGETGFNKQDYLVKFRVNTKPDAKVYQALTIKLGQTLERSDESYLGLTEDDFARDPLMRYAGSQLDEMRTKHTIYSGNYALVFSPALSTSVTLYRADFHRNWFKIDAVRDLSGQKAGIGDILKTPATYSEQLAIIKGNLDAIAGNLDVKNNNRNYTLYGLQTRFNYNFSSSWANHKLELGFRIHHDEVDRFQWVDIYNIEDGIMELETAGIPGTESNRIDEADAIASYIQYTLDLGKISLYPGLRFESIDLYRKDYGKSDPDRTGSEIAIRENAVHSFIPGIGAEWRLDQNYILFGGVHKGFAPPGSRPGTKPEESINYEIGSRALTNFFQLEAVLFYNDFQNLLGADLAASGGTGSGDLFNGGKAQSYGVELQFAFDPFGNPYAEVHVPFNIVYTYTRATFESSFESENEGWGVVQKGDELPYLAPHRISLHIGIIHNAFEINLSCQAVDRMRTQPGPGTKAISTATDPYFTIDLSGRYFLKSGMSVFAGLSNLTDATYLVARRPAGLRPNLPRTFQVGILAKI